MAIGQQRKEREQAAIDAVLAEHKGAHRDSLIPILQHMQDRVGYLSVAAVRSIAHHLHLPASKVYGVATFYNQFRFMPKGKYHVQVCRGTACHVKGSLATLDAVRQELRGEPGETSKNGAYSIERGGGGVHGGMRVGAAGVCEWDFLRRHDAEKGARVA